MSLPRYPEYKASGVEWLGEVPGHWEAKRLKNITLINMGQSPSSDDCNQEGVGLPFLQGNADFGETFPLPRSYCAVATKLANVGDILFSVRAPVGAINIANQTYGIGRGLCAITASSGNSIRYIFHALQVMKSELFAVATGSTYEAVSTDQVGNATCFVPDQKEQIQIAAFLDRETGKIDALIAEQRRLVELLAEKRQAVISHAVTKGLNPNAPMKDSGIEWLGEVPEHWEVKRVKHLIHSIEQGWSPQCEGFPVETSDEWGVLKVGCVNGGVFNPAENKTLPEILEPIASLGIAKNDVLISRANTRELVGSAAVAQENYPRLMLCDKLYRLKMIVDLCLPEFLVYYLGIGKTRGQIELAASGASSSMLNIAQSTVLELEIALPNSDEQQTIATFLNIETAKFDTLTTEANRAIALLQERRSALISAAVTGKIDVRTLSPFPLPQASKGRTMEVA